MSKGHPLPKRLAPDASRVTACVFRTPWGWMGVSETTKGIDAVVLPKASRQAVLTELQAASSALLDAQVSSRLREARAQLIDYLAGTRRSFDLSLDLSRGTSFQRKVWRTLRRVSYGQLRSYQWVAVRVGGRRYARAVGNAVDELIEPANLAVEFVPAVVVEIAGGGGLHPQVPVVHPLPHLGADDFANDARVLACRCQ